MRFYTLPTSEIIDYDASLLTQALKQKGASFRDPRIFIAPKLVNRQTADSLIFALDDTGYCTLNSAHNTQALDGNRGTLLYLLGLLNSKLLIFYYRQRSQETRDAFPQVHISALRQLPIPMTDSCNHTDKARHNRMVKLVETMLDLHKQLATTKTSHEKTAIQRQIDTTDKEIDQLVYELYDLSEEEIRIVEEATK